MASATYKEVRTGSADAELICGVQQALGNSRRAGDVSMLQLSQWWSTVRAGRAAVTSCTSICTRPAAALRPEERFVCHKLRPVNIQQNAINYSGRSGQHALLVFKSDSRASHYRNDMKVVNSEKNWLHGHLFLIYRYIIPKKHHEVVHDYSTTSNLPSICDPWWGE